MVHKPAIRQRAPKPVSDIREQRLPILEWFLSDEEEYACSQDTKVFWKYSILKSYSDPSHLLRDQF